MSPAHFRSLNICGAVPALSIRAVARFTRSEYEPQTHSRGSELFVFGAIITVFYAVRYS